MASVNKVELRRLYVEEQRSIPDVAKALGLAVSTARTRLLDAGITLRSRADGVRAVRSKLGIHMVGKKRTFTNAWKQNMRASRKAWADKNAKGESTRADGYTEITRGKHKGRPLHVVLMEEHLGRSMLNDEIVHHIDGNPRNNTIENLMVMTRAEHTRYHCKQRAQHGKR